MTQSTTDELSRPLVTTKTKFGIKYKIPVRNEPKKPGRKLTVIWDDRYPLKPHFKNRYSYQVEFTKKGSLAGNHVHKKKSEFFIPLKGSFIVILENPKTGEQETIDLKPTEVLYIPAGIAHVVIAKSAKSILLVIANHPNNDADEFKYEIKKEQK